MLSPEIRGVLEALVQAAHEIPDLERRLEVAVNRRRLDDVDELLVDGLVLQIRKSLKKDKERLATAQKFCAKALVLAKLGKDVDVIWGDVRQLAEASALDREESEAAFGLIELIPSA